MQSLTGHEPHLELGDSGDWVLQLQVRLYLLGYFQEWPAGAYGMSTESAVRDVQSARGLDNTGETEFSTWEAILYLEQQAAIDYYWHSPHDALAQIQYDLEHPAVQHGTVSEDGHYRFDGTEWVANSREAAVQAGETVSEDGHYRWDGSSWQLLDHAGHDGGDTGHAGASYGGDAYQAVGTGHVSEDGRYRWDGTQWHEIDQYASLDHVGLVSDDGHWRWDGAAWQPHVPV